MHQARLVKSFATELLADVLWWKLRFLGFLRECNSDRTLEKVAHYMADGAVGQIAEALAALGHSEAARALLESREAPLTPANVLPKLDIVARNLVQGYRLKPKPPAAGKTESLAEVRVRLLIQTLCDEDRRLRFTAADAPKLLEKSPAALDRLYSVAARLNGLALLPEFVEAASSGKAAEEPGTTHQENDRKVAPGQPNNSELTKVEKAIQIYLRDTNQSDSEIAREVGCHPSLLSRNKRFQKVKSEYERAYRDRIPRGSKTRDGAMEAEDP
jgi:hypothetical protein